MATTSHEATVAIRRSPVAGQFGFGLRATLLVLVLVAFAACASQASEIDGILERSFNNVDELVAVMDCGGQWVHAESTEFPPPQVSSVSEVTARARSIMGTGEQPTLDDAKQAGKVWLLIDDTGRAFGGWAQSDDGDELVYCSEG